MRLKIDVIPTGKTTATVVLTQEQVDTLRGTPGKARVPLAITFRQQTFRTSISMYRAQWMMVVNQQMRDGGLIPGNSYTVDIVRDTSERTVEVPDDLAQAIKAAKATTAWERLSYTARKEHVRKVLEAKTQETRDRRIAKVIDSLSG